jgi:hypothetical protein
MCSYAPGMKRSEEDVRYCREDEGSKVEMVWTRNKKR